MMMKTEPINISKTKTPFTKRISEKDYIVLFHIFKFSLLLAATIGAGYAFYHAGAGSLTIPEHFKKEVFNPNVSVGQNVLIHRFDIFWYWIDRGFYIGIASFFSILLTSTSIALLFKKIIK